MSDFRIRVLDIVEQIPRGRVMTYGQIAAIAGSPRAARIVGGIAHYGPVELPWHRIVNKAGGLAMAFPGGRTEHARRLTEEGIELDMSGNVELNKYLWWPLGSNINE